MSYTPLNEFVFIQAFTGAVAGLTGQSTSFPLARGSYDTAIDIAGAWAQEVDIQWAVYFGTQPDLFEFNEILTFSEDHFQATEPQQNSGVTGVGSSTNPATYTKLAQALMTILLDGEAYLAGMGIIPPPFQCCLVDVTLKPNLAAYQIQPGQDVWCIDPVAMEVWSFTFPTISKCPDGAEVGLLDGSKGGGFSATEYATIANPDLNIEDPGAQPTCTNNPIIVQNPGETSRWRLNPARTFWKVV